MAHTGLITLSINDKRAEVDRDISLLDAIEKQGIKIPTLCHHKALTPYGACRLCIVEIHAAGRSPAIHASCSYPVQQGMVVYTDTGRVKNARRIVAELLLARCPDSEAIQRIAFDHGVTKPRISTKNDDCVYCGLCVRMCEERMGRSAIGFTGRGPRKKLESPFGMHNDRCWACGACDFICPVGKKIRTLTSKNVPVPILNHYNLGLSNRSVAHILYPQAVPNYPVIDADQCVHLNNDACGICEDVCGPKAINFNQKDTTVEVNVGAIVLSPGSEAFDPSAKKELGYGIYLNVITSLQFERILSPSGPYAGKVLRPSDLKAPRRIAFIQCVGSREAEWDYCSAVCCMYATKEALIAKEHAGEDLGCDVFFMDIRAYSKGFEAYFEAAKKRGVNYIRCRIPRVQELSDSRNLSITYLGQADRKETREYDMVVLSVGLHPPKNVEHLAETFGVELNSNRFCKTTTFAPVETTRKGVFAVGPFVEPKDIPETVVQASAAAAKTLSLLREARGSLIVPRTYPPEINTKGEEPRIGVFVCKCGTNIAGFLSVPDVTAYAQTLPNVVFADHSLYTCSNDIQEKIKCAIVEHKLNRVVVASCTPRTHEALFKNTIREAGLNPYLFEMANIRNQCSWVHMHERDKATAKAKDLVRMAVAKVRLNESLYPRPLEVVHSALVIGGGLAGLTAALEIAEQGFRVFLVEKEQTPGGFMKRVYYLLTEDEPQEKIANLIHRVETHSNIKVYVNATVKEVRGSLGNFESTISIAGYDNPVSINHGVIIVATGSDIHLPSEYLYGKDSRVLLNEQLEEQIAFDEFKGTSVAFIQCVGSRQPERPYCSRTCCSETVKHALQLKKMSPETQVYVLYRELRTFGFREAYYTKARALGVTFIRFPDDQPPIVMGHNGKLSVDVVAATISEKLRLLVDNVVLATATVPRQDSKELAQVLKVPLSEDNFFLEAHRKLRPVDFSTDGIFLCGNAYAPFGVAETISQGLATAARAGSILGNKQIDLEPTISHVVEEKCDGCAYCVDPCPFKAITLVEYELNGETKKRVQVNESVCKGCGTCMATCPKKAIYVWHFRPEQLSAQVKAALELPM